ncbi:MAG TPA: glutaminyl-peptide cyclotransferase [Pyrinomonadaceae bacterium]|nr:glutaminyl-peptide cyclotransferase [Pyrinomonadaceae bacterium]
MLKPAILTLMLLLSAACSREGSGSGATRSATKAPVYTFEVVNAWPHDTSAYTQGLEIHGGALYESTGQYGASSLRQVELQTGRVLRRIDVPRQYFAEGLTVFQGKLYQLTWQSHKGFVYDPNSFQSLGEFHIETEGWGLTHDERSLIMSDGTNQIRFLNPVNYTTEKSIKVFDGDHPLTQLNELEYIKGEIYANIWKTDWIVRIDPETGKILGWIDLKNLLPLGERSADTDVLNGIAYDEAHDRLFVTGKLWPKLFEIRLKKR